MPQTEQQPRIRNGVNVDALFPTLDAVKANPELGKFVFRAQNQWIDGSHNRTTIQNFFGAGQEMERAAPFMLDAGEPAILVGHDEGPNPAELLLHALAACLTTSLVYVAAARSVPLIAVRSEIEGQLDVQGALGLSDDVRNGYTHIRVTFHVESDAPREKVAEVVQRAQQRSAVYDVVSRGTRVDVVLAD